MYLEKLREVLDNDMSILEKTSADPLGLWQGAWNNMEKDAAGTPWAELLRYWTPERAGGSLAANFGKTVGWAGKNPAQGMGLGVAAGLALPRLMNMLQGIINPGRCY